MPLPASTSAATYPRLRGGSYDRISKIEARKNLVEGVEVQVVENQEYADAHNIEIVGVYKDNLTASRFSRRDRPEFMRMLTDIQAGKIDVVLVTEQSRLDRQLWNILELIELARTTPFRMIIKTRDGEVLDLSTESGINRAIDQANRDRHESELLSQRIKGRKRARARDGLWDGGSRPFGYEADGVTVRESEAAVIRECADKILAGQSLFSIVRELNNRGVKTATGHLWRTANLKRLFESRRMIGIRTHDGAEYPACWPAILPRETWEEIQATMKTRHSTWSNRRRSRRYLLTGFLECGRCGAKLVGHGFPPGRGNTNSSLATTTRGPRPPGRGQAAARSAVDPSLWRRS